MEDKLKQDYKNYKANLEGKLKLDYSQWLEKEVKEARRELKFIAIVAVALLILLMLVAIFPEAMLN